VNPGGKHTLLSNAVHWKNARADNQLGDRHPGKKAVNIESRVSPEKGENTLKKTWALPNRTELTRSKKKGPEKKENKSRRKGTGKDLPKK